MDRNQIETEHVVARYLAGQLSEAEDREFESFVALHPDFYAEVERTLRLKEGLAALQHQGRLQALLRPRRSYLKSYLTAAAAAVLAAFGGLLWYHTQQPATVILAASPSALTLSGAAMSRIGARYVLVRSRLSGSTADLRVSPQAGVVELRMLPANASAQHYVATLVTSPSSRQIAKVSGLARGGDLYVTLYLDVGALARGDYDILLTPDEPAAVSAEGDRFRVQVR